ncbi:MAG: glucosaminidase domain-containing protein [Myroides sp.]
MDYKKYQIAKSVAISLAFILLAASFMFNDVCKMSNNNNDKLIEMSDTIEKYSDKIDRLENENNRLKNALNLSVDTKITGSITNNKSLNKFIDKKGLNKFISAGELTAICSKYYVDPGFVLATFSLETGYGKSDSWINDNNPGGITCGNSYCAYDNKLMGFDKLAKLLSVYSNGSDEFIGRKLTVNEVRNIWSETDDSQKIVNIWQEILLSEFEKGV